MSDATCPDCGNEPDIRYSEHPLGIAAFCACVDGAPDSPGHLCGYGHSQVDAWADWFVANAIGEELL